MNRKRLNYDLGNAISIEDALSIMIVTFVLFVLFLIPLVNIDKTKLEEAQTDTYWNVLADYIKNNPSNSETAAPYIHTFDLYSHTVIVNSSGDKVYIEAVNPAGEITIIQHDGTKYISLMTKGSSTVVTYRYGDIHWSTAEKEWFTTNNTIDYGEKNFTIAMQKSFRQWTKAERGF